jgi:predicted HD phosphohydrolase
MPDENIQELTSANIVAFIADIFDRRGGEAYLGEPVTTAEHMLQGATLAEQGGRTDEIIAGALLHDIGHFTSEFGAFSMDDTEDRYHEVAGARVLQPFFPATIVDCVHHHVAAKRYLCATRTRYIDRLSPASLHSLNLQGGPMSNDEVEAFEKNPNLKQIIQVRHLDDSGKREGGETYPFSHFVLLLQRLVDQHLCGKA